MTKARSCVCRLGLVFFLLELTICQGAPRRAPTTYDQRQDGKFNLHASFQDTFVVFGLPSSSSSSSSSLADSDFASLFQNGLLTQALELKNTVTEETGNETSEGTASKNIESARSVLVDSPTLRSAIRAFVGRELADQSDQGNDDKVKVFAIVRKNLPLDLETSEQLSEQLSDPSPEDDVDPKDTPATLQTHNTELNAPTLKITTRSVPDNLDEKSQSENSKTDNNDDLNCVGRKELRLIGDGIENCGPERYRDDEGRCRSCPTTPSTS